VGAAYDSSLSSVTQKLQHSHNYSGIANVGERNKRILAAEAITVLSTRSMLVWAGMRWPVSVRHGHQGEGRKQFIQTNNCLQMWIHRDTMPLVTPRMNCGVEVEFESCSTWGHGIPTESQIQESSSEECCIEKEAGGHFTPARASWFPSTLEKARAKNLRTNRLVEGACSSLKAQMNPTTARLYRTRNGRVLFVGPSG
jgi:hypothetical protein